MKQEIRIGGGMAFFDDSMLGFTEMLDAGVDYIVTDYLAEVSMAFLAADKVGNPEGFSPAFLRDFRPYLKRIVEEGTKIVTNWGGLNPKGAARALEALCSELGVTPKIAVVEGDDLRSRASEYTATGLRDMFNGQSLPLEKPIGSMNAYLGAFPIADALKAGADVVITGRVVDSALSLGALIHEFSWGVDDYDRLAAGTLVGHLMECSAQCSGGIFTDWMLVDWENIGKPIARCREDGSFVIYKTKNSGGMVSIGTVAEQMVYEIGDPQAYYVPDVVCDFSNATFTEIAPDEVEVKGVTGYPPTDQYKVCTVYQDGWRAQVFQPFIGMAAVAKAKKQGEAIFARTNRVLRDRNIKPIEGHIELIGAETTFGTRARQQATREVVAMLTADHDERVGAEVFLKEQIVGGGAMAPGTAMNLVGNNGTGVIPRMKVFSFLIPKTDVKPVVTFGDSSRVVETNPARNFDGKLIARPSEPERPDDIDDNISVPLVALAWARSGDKGDLFNVGAIARRPEYYPYMAAALTVDTVNDWFVHMVDPTMPTKVERFLLPGSRALNFVVHNSLDGGGSVARRVDRLAKSMGQMLLEMPVPVSAAIAAQALAEFERRDPELCAELVGQGA